MVESSASDKDAKDVYEFGRGLPSWTQRKLLI
jgi:hypothetical protein